MLFSADDHATNPPESWEVVKLLDGVWELRTADGGSLERFGTRKAAMEAKSSGFLFDLYHQERRWMAGEPVRGWRPYAEIVG